MSTRANIIIKDKYNTLYFYRHSDGYPECCGEDLKDFADISLNDLKACSDWLDLKALVHKKAALGLRVS